MKCERCGKLLLYAQMPIILNRPSLKFHWECLSKEMDDMEDRGLNYFQKNEEAKNGS